MRKTGKGIDKLQPSLCSVVNIVFPTHKPTHTHHIANRTAKNGYRHIWLRADTLAPNQPLGLTGKIPLSEKYRKLTELISLIGQCVGRQPLHATRVWRDGGITSRGQILLFSHAVGSRGKCVESRHRAKPQNVRCHLEKCVVMKYLFFLISLFFFVGCKPLTNTNPRHYSSFRNQGEQEDYWAKQLFEKEYKKYEYSKFSEEIKTNNSEIQFGKIQCIKYSDYSDSEYNKYKLIFEKGLLYPDILGVDTLDICCLKELTFLSNSPKIKRFRFLLWETIGDTIIMNPNVYLFELTNEKANIATGWEIFIENAKLTFIKYGWTRI